MPPSPPLFSKSRAGSVSALGEQGLIRAIRRWLGKACPPSPGGIGDDCAVLPAQAGRTLVTVDPVIQGIHFDARTTAAQAGAKLLKRNLSDIAAMGGRPGAAVISLAMDPGTSTAWLEAFYRGLARESIRHRCPVVGGDVARLPGQFSATLTLIGAAGPRILERRGAAAGDSICVTGLLGRSFPTGHHHRFSPRLAEGAWLAARPEVRAAMDVSDGLAKDLDSLLPPGTVARIEPASLPRRDGASVREALGDGEDYELVFALAAAADWDLFRRDWGAAFPRTALTRIGRFVRRPHRSPAAGGKPASNPRGYDHF